MAHKCIVCKKKGEAVRLTIISQDDYGRIQGSATFLCYNHIPKLIFYEGFWKPYTHHSYRKIRNRIRSVIWHKTMAD
jgi:hypothetical protein